MKRNLLLLLFLCIGHTAFAQGDFTSAREQRVIAKRHIKQITCYYFADATKPTDSVLVDSLAFYKTGLCLKQTNNYRYSNEYGAKSRLVKQTVTTKDRSDQSITMFEYDMRGNMILAETVNRWQYIHSPYPDFTQHRFEYGPRHELLREYWTNFKGQSIQRQRYEYVYKGLEVDIEKIVNFYDEKDQLTFTKKYYKNGLVKDYSIDNGKSTFAAESVLNHNHNLLKFTDHYHFDPDRAKAKRETLTEVYKYDKYGFCTKKETYKNDKLINYCKWYFN